MAAKSSKLRVPQKDSNSQLAATKFSIANSTSKAYNKIMLTLIETPLFSSRRKDYWTEEEFGEFTVWLANNPESGSVVRQSGGVRKIRWARSGAGKSGGYRVIYYNRLQNGEIWLLVMYAKNESDSMPAHILKAIKEEIEK